MKDYDTVKKDSPENITTQIREDLKKKILTGKWQPNGKLPSERELSNFYKVSRLSVRHALTELAQTGIVYRRPTKGTFIKNQKEIERQKYYFQKCIGLVIYPFLRVSFFTDIISSISRNLSKNGLGLVFNCCDEDVFLEKKYIEELVSNNIQGLIVISGGESMNGIPAFQEIDAQIPVLVINVVFGDIDADFILSEDEKGAFDAVTHLIELGHRQILHLAGSEKFSGSEIFSTAGLRAKGYERALENAGIGFDEKLIRITDWTAKSGYCETKKFLMNNKDKISAIFACNDEVALGAFKAIREMGLTVPEDISIVGYGNLDFGSYLEVPLTTVDQNPERIGEEAVILMTEKLQGKTPLSHVEKVTVPANLIIRDSCGIKTRKSVSL